MTEPPANSLRKDMRVFRDPGFLITLLLIGLLAAVGAYILVRASNDYGIPLQEYWR
jgi:multisubunit Na+/H+ antiporter MnhG subunit